MNSCNFTGRLATMPELRKTQDGTSVCRFRIAVRRTYKTNGEYITDFLNIVAWRSTAEYIERYISKGQLISVTASAQTRSYETKSGDKVTTVEFVAENVESLAQKPQKDEAAEQGNVTQYNDSSEQDMYPTSLSDEDLPF